MVAEDAVELIDERTIVGKGLRALNSFIVRSIVAVVSLIAISLLQNGTGLSVTSS